MNIKEEIKERTMELEALSEAQELMGHATVSVGDADIMYAGKCEDDRINLGTAYCGSISRTDFSPFGCSKDDKAKYLYLGLLVVKKQEAKCDREEVKKRALAKLNDEEKEVLGVWVG